MAVWSDRLRVLEEDDWARAGVGEVGVSGNDIRVGEALAGGEAALLRRLWLFLSRAWGTAFAALRDARVPCEVRS